MIIEEKYSHHWITVTGLLIAAAAGLFIGYSLIENILWKGILRLASFACLAGAVFSGLKVMQGKHEVELLTEDDDLVIVYRRDGRTISRDLFELEKIGTVSIERHSDYLGKYLFSEDLNIRFVPADSDRPLNLIEVHGRALALSNADADRIIRFIQERVPDVNIARHTDI